MNLVELGLYTLLVVILGLMLVSFFLIWNWFDARERLHIVRADTREETIRGIHHGHNKCRVLLYISILLALLYVAMPFVIGDYLNTLAYPAIVIIADILMLVGLRRRSRDYIKSIDFYINLNEQYVHKQEEELKQKREEWKRKAAESNPKAEAVIRENLGDNYEIWFKHDILTALNVVANTEKGVLYAQGAIVPFHEIMEVRQGRKNLKLLTENSLYPYIIIDFDVQAVNPATGQKYKEEIAAKIEQQMR
ncbi:MAG: hypothetical protein J5621_01315 [Paludibacteraceae bacterium]|nr:hypothetical protein [Paludibacteraceae bacterium]